MAWKASGDERVRSYKIYRELEEAYAELSAVVEGLKNELARKDVLIRSLAQELNSLAERVGTPEPIVPKLTKIEGGLEVTPPDAPSSAEVPAALRVTKRSPVSGERPASKGLYKSIPTKAVAT